MNSLRSLFTDTVVCVFYSYDQFSLLIVIHYLFWMNNQSLSGQPLSGPDIGGFAGDATPRLFARWMGIGALFPFSRGHSEKDTIDHEPWSFGAEVCC